MRIKKINSILAQCASASLLLHTLCTTVSMLSGFSFYPLHKLLAELLAVSTLLHCLLSLFIVLIVQKGPVIKKYKNESKRVIIQRDSGILVLIIMFWHMNSLKFMSTGEIPSTGRFIFILAGEVIFFLLCYAHLGISYSRSLITFGKITNDQDEKKADGIITKVCAVMAVIAVIAVAYHLASYII